MVGRRGLTDIARGKALSLGLVGFEIQVFDRFGKALVAEIGALFARLAVTPAMASASTTAMAVAAAAAAVAAAAVRAVVFLILSMGAGLLVEERLPVGNGDLVVVGVDFRKGEKAVPIAAVLDEGGL